MSDNNRSSLTKISEALGKEILPTNIVRKQPVAPLDLDRAGQLSSQAFNEMANRILDDIKETAENQINNANNQRNHAKVTMEQLASEMDKAWEPFQVEVKKHQERLQMISAAVQVKVAEDTKEMIALGEKLKTFATTVDKAHDMLFAHKDDSNGEIQ